MLIHPWDAVDNWRALLPRFEPADSTRLPPATSIESDRRVLPGIRGLRIAIDHVRAKQKYGGNKPDEQRRDIAARLADRAGPGDAAAVRHLPPQERN